MSLPPHPKPPWPTEDVKEALANPDLNFKEFDTWRDLFFLAQKHGRTLYVRQILRGCPASRYQVASVAPSATATDCPVVLFNAGGLFGDDFGNLGGSLVLHFEPPIRRTVIDRFEFGDPEIR
jgi:hypothetical protein